MRKSILGLSAVLLATVATPALAQEDDGSGITISGGAALVSDYRFRGVSQTNKEFAIQGTLSVSHESGLYATVWGSSIDDYVAGGADAEIDFIVGYKKSFGPTTVDVGVLYYYYPGGEQIISEYPTDFFEPYVSVSHVFGPVTGKLLAAYAPKQNALSIGSGKEDNLYLAADLSAAVPNTPVTLTAHVGNTFGRSYLSAGFEDVTDWSLGATYTYKNLSFGVSYVDTEDNIYSGISGKNLSKAGVVGSVSVAF